MLRLLSIADGGQLPGARIGQRISDWKNGLPMMEIGRIGLIAIIHNALLARQGVRGKDEDSKRKKGIKKKNNKAVLSLVSAKVLWKRINEIQACYSEKAVVNWQRVRG